jgi:hypothetical protein
MSKIEIAWGTDWLEVTADGILIVSAVGLTTDHLARLLRKLGHTVEEREMSTEEMSRRKLIYEI